MFAEHKNALLAHVCLCYGVSGISKGPTLSHSLFPKEDCIHAVGFRDCESNIEIGHYSDQIDTELIQLNSISVVHTSYTGACEKKHSNESRR